MESRGGTGELGAGVYLGASSSSSELRSPSQTQVATVIHGRPSAMESRACTGELGAGAYLGELGAGAYLSELGAGAYCGEDGAGSCVPTLGLGMSVVTCCLLGARFLRGMLSWRLK